MTQLDEQGRPTPPITGDELATALGFLDFQRATLKWRCDGLDAAGLRATTSASTMTLGGILKHMALVEENWFSYTLHNREWSSPWDAVDWDADRDWEWHTAAGDTPADLLAMWDAAVARSREDVALALEGGGLEQVAKRVWTDGTAVSLRWIVLHMLEEYARHNGHADLLRESIDGLTGE